MQSKGDTDKGGILVIVMDLEWNYGTADEEALRQGKTLKFEIIQIGVAMVDDRGKIIKTFEHLIAPQIHTEMKQKVVELTGITAQRLKGKSGFAKVWEEFCRWKGSEQEIVFWGNCDRSVLLSNLLYYGFSDGESLILYDLQALFGLAMFESSQQTALASALTALRLVPYGQYHSALSDAVNAAAIFRVLGGREFIRKNQPRLIEQNRKKQAAESEDGTLFFEKTFVEITDIGQIQSCFEPELVRQMKNPVIMMLSGFYRNHKKVWVYRSQERLIKVTSRSRPAKSGRGKDFVVKFYEINQEQLDTLKQWSRRQEKNRIKYFRKIPRK